MNSPVPIRYPLDPSGTNPNNLVVGEPRQLSNRQIRSISPAYGAFYADSMTIKDMATGQNLTSSQFKSTEMFPWPTDLYGKIICGIVLITDPTVSNNVEITYQALGGEYSTNSDAIVAMLETLDLDNRPVNWHDIINKPQAFPPDYHLHDIGDVYGFEYVVQALERIRQAILLGDAVSHDEIYRYIDAAIAGVSGGADQVRQELLAHINNTSNPHNTTKQQVGLGNVPNFAMSQRTDSEAGTSDGLFMSPLQVSYAISAQVGSALNTHINRTDNPHNTTKTHVGLGSVDNFATATQVQAEAGSANNLFMTPLRTAQYVTAALAGSGFSTHIGRTDNPHNTTKAQVGLSNVDNFVTADNGIAAAGTSTTHFVTPAGVAAAVTAQVGNELRNHINSTANPHGTTKGQVGLGAVENYPIATQGEAEGGSINTAYMTPLRTAQEIAARVQIGVNVQGWSSNLDGLAAVSNSNGFLRRNGAGWSVDGTAYAALTGANFSGAVNMGAGLGVTGTATVGTIAATTGTISGNLGVTGSATVGGLTTSGTVQGGALSTGGTVSAATANIGSGGLTVTGTSNVANMNVTGTVAATGDLSAFSDERLKDNIRPLARGLQSWLQLQGIVFTRKSDGRESMGLSAQKTQAVYPEVITTDLHGYLSVNYGALIGGAVEADRELFEIQNKDREEHLALKQKYEDLVQQFNSFKELVMQRLQFVL